MHYGKAQSMIKQEMCFPSPENQKQHSHPRRTSSYRLVNKKHKLANKMPGSHTSKKKGEKDKFTILKLWDRKKQTNKSKSGLFTECFASHSS